MDNQEAIKSLKTLCHTCKLFPFPRCAYEKPECFKAIDMAISALQEQEETVSRKVYEQISWERDIAVMQLKDLGYSLGEKIRTDGNLISRADAIDAAMEYGKKIPTYSILVKNAIEQLPSAQPDHTADISKKVSNSCGHENDLISRQAAIELKPEFLNPNVNRETEEQTAIDRAYARGWNSCNTHWIDEINELPSAQPEIKPIDYQDCANAMMRMWMDEVVTDGEYNRIMDKLNAFWRTRNERFD